MKISSRQYALSLLELIGESSEQEAGLILKKFVDLVLANNDDYRIDEIVTELSRAWNEQNDQLDVSLTSARGLTDSSQKIIADYLKAKTSRHRINFSHQVDPEIMGGVVLRYGDKIVDSSLKNNLNSLKNKINK